MFNVVIAEVSIFQEGLLYIRKKKSTINKSPREELS